MYVFVACASSILRAAMINCSAFNGTFVRSNHTCLPASYDVTNNVTSSPEAASVMSPTDDFFQ